jgi:hypothetical protein
MKIYTKISLSRLHIESIIRQYIYSSIEGAEVALVFEHNNAFRIIEFLHFVHRLEF